METDSFVPPGGQVLTPYICPRDAVRAIGWYADVFDAVETVERFVDPDGRIGHAQIDIGGADIMISDSHPDYGAVAPESGAQVATFALSLYVPDADATVAMAERLGATVQRPVDEQFYGSRMGVILDPFGVRWMVNTHVHDVSGAEMGQAAREYPGAAPGPVGTERPSTPGQPRVVLGLLLLPWL